MTVSKAKLQRINPFQKKKEAPGLGLLQERLLRGISILFRYGTPCVDEPFAIVRIVAFLPFIIGGVRKLTLERA